MNAIYIIILFPEIHHERRNRYVRAEWDDDHSDDDEEKEEEEESTDSDSDDSSDSSDGESEL